MINTLEELLQDYARYSFMEGTIDENTSMHLVEDAQNYIKVLSKENLLSIGGVVKSLFCKCRIADLNYGLGSNNICNRCNRPSRK